MNNDNLEYNETALPEPTSSQKKSGWAIIATKYFGSIISGVLIIVIAFLITSKLNSETITVEQNESTEIPSSSEASNLPEGPINTFCTFYEKNIGTENSRVSGILHTVENGKTIPITLNSEDGEYVHFLDAIDVHALSSEEENDWVKIDLLSKGRPVKVRKLDEQLYIGSVGNEEIFKFFLDEKTGKYSYSQFQELDQPILSEQDTRIINLTFKIHVHLSSLTEIEKSIQIKIYDKTHEPNVVTVNLK